MTKKYLKILTAGSAGIVTTNLMGYGSLTLLGFGIFMLTFISVSLIWHLFDSSLKHKFNLTKVTFFIGGFLILLGSAGYFILWQYQQSPPYSNTVLDQHRGLNKLYAQLVQFHPHLSNHTYRSLRYRFAEYLIAYDLSAKEKQQIWQNYLKLFVLQTKIRNLFVDIKVNILDDTISYGYEYNYGVAKVTPFSIKSFITTFNNHEEGASIPSQYNKKPTKKLRFKDYGTMIRANLPYFNNSIPIQKEDIEKIKMIYKMNKLSAQILEINQRYTNL